MVLIDVLYDELSIHCNKHELYAGFVYFSVAPRVAVFPYQGLSAYLNVIEDCYCGLI